MKVRVRNRRQDVLEAEDQESGNLDWGWGYDRIPALAAAFRGNSARSTEWTLPESLCIFPVAILVSFATAETNYSIPTT